MVSTLTLVLCMCWCWYSESNSGSLKYDWSWSHVGAAIVSPCGNGPPSADSKSRNTDLSRISFRCDLRRGKTTGFIRIFYSFSHSPQWQATVLYNKTFGGRQANGFCPVTRGGYRVRDRQIARKIMRNNVVYPQTLARLSSAEKKTIMSCSAEKA